MRNYIFLVTIFCVYHSSVLAKATVCNGDGVCITYTEVNLQGAGWMNACCVDLNVPAEHSCTDDCDDEVLPRLADRGLPLLGGQGINGMDFSYDLEDGSSRDVSVILKDDGLYMNGKIHLHLEGVMGLRLEIGGLYFELSLQPKLSQEELNQIAELAASVSINHPEVEVFPNPASKNGELLVKADRAIGKVVVYDATGRSVHEVIVSKKQMELSIAVSTLGTAGIVGGVVYVQVFDTKHRLMSRETVLIL